MQDFLEVQSKAAERHSMRVQELDHQLLTATQVTSTHLSAIWYLFCKRLSHMQMTVSRCTQVYTLAKVRLDCWLMLVLVLQPCPPVLHMWLSWLVLSVCPLHLPV